MTADKTAEAILTRWDALKSQRTPYESQWNEIQKLVRAHAKSMYQQQEGDRRFDGIYDSTAVESLEQLASGLHSYLTSPSERWFALEVTQRHELNDDPDALLWLERIADIIFDVYQNPRTSFTTALHEGYLDLGGFGHCVIYQEEDHDACVRFRIFPVADCWIAEDSQGMVDTLFRQTKMTGRQMQQLWEELPDVVKKPENIDKEWIVIHAVFPRSDRNAMKLGGKNKKFASFWVLAELKVTLHEGGFDLFPYHVPRWFKLSDEKYGRSPAMKCLPDIKMLNKLEITTLRAGTKQVDPPMVIPDDGFLLPIQTHPGALIFKEANSAEIQVLETKGNLPWAEEKSEQKRGAIRRAFHIDWVMRQRKNPNVEQSATEVVDDRDESLRMMSPMLGRLQSELLGPILERTFGVLRRRGYIPQPPQSLAGLSMKLVYISPAAKAQQGTKAIGIGKTFADLAPLAQLDPTVLDAIDLDEAAQQLALARGTTRKIIRSKEQIAQIRADRAKQQQAQNMAGMMEPASKAALNMAKAKEAGGGIGVM